MTKREDTHLIKEAGQTWCGQPILDTTLTSDDLEAVGCYQCLHTVWNAGTYPDMEALKKRIVWYISTGD